MKQYNLINRQTGQETICNKVTIDGLDYYTEDGSIVRPIDFSKYQYQKGNGIFRGMDGMKQGEVYEVIATTNPSIDLPKVVDELDVIDIAENMLKSHLDFEAEGMSEYQNGRFNGIIEGYNKSQETHPFSEEDMVEFKNWWLKQDIEWFDNTEEGDVYKLKNGKTITDKELLQLWKEQQPKIVWYE